MTRATGPLRILLACMMLSVGLAFVPAPADVFAPAPERAEAIPVPTTVPVLLVPGWFDTDRDLAALRIRLIGAGWAVENVASVSFSEPTGENRQHAAEIGEAARRLAERTGAEKIDIVAHSMGGLAARWYLLHDDDAPVRRVVFLATPHHGTMTAYLAWGDGGQNMKPGSPFLDSLNAGPVLPPGMEALTVRTPLDTHVIPGENGILAGIPDRTVCCPTHAGLLRSMDAFRILRRFLEHGLVDG